eukprot:snap_masked-scaffold_1-processed-gene-8.25-mRNA-1 protein AED:1.00 eAED:1.00 QI:0/0/0/0/1/1/2/0/61
MKILLLIINQNADSFVDNQNQNDYQIIIDNFYQIIPLVASDTKAQCILTYLPQGYFYLPMH